VDFLIEIIAVFTGITSVWFAKKENVWLYPVGIISVLLWIYLCWIGKLFGQSVINLFFFLMNGYGWYNWLRKDADNKPNIFIKNNTEKENISVVLIAIVLSIIIYFLLIPLQDEKASLLYVLLEAIITALNFVAMWLMAWKRVEHWLLWIIGDILCIPLFIHKDYPIGVLQFMVFIFIAYLGYKEWKLKVYKP
jgi:nicotinamide mononucleotide transporter|tara:strand:- start:184 stop:762 length:579 start_codon:yes stop_codon:yes gene_type:complete